MCKACELWAKLAVTASVRVVAAVDDVNEYHRLIREECLDKGGKVKT